MSSAVQHHSRAPPQKTREDECAIKHSRAHITLPRRCVLPRLLQSRTRARQLLQKTTALPTWKHERRRSFVISLKNSDSLSSLFSCASGLCSARRLDLLPSAFVRVAPACPQLDSHSLCPSPCAMLLDERTPLTDCAISFSEGSCMHHRPLRVSEHNEGCLQIDGKRHFGASASVQLHGERRRLKGIRATTLL